MNRVGTGDAMIGLGVIALVMAALLPTYRARAFNAAVESAVADVEAVRQATSRIRSTTGAWPTAVPPGMLPNGSSGALPADSALIRDGYAIEWRLWQRVEEELAPARSLAPPILDPDEQPPLTGLVAADAPPDSAAAEVIEAVRTEGAVVVHSSEPLLLAALLRQHGSAVSFVRDTTWTLLLIGEPSG